MTTRTIKPREDMLTLIVVDATGKRIWTQEVKAIPRVGDDVLLFTSDGKDKLYGATVSDVIWGLFDKIAGQVVTIKLGPNLLP